MRIADAIVQVETGGKCSAIGKTGERGCFQFMPGTWRYWSTHVLGYVAEQTPITERYVALHKIQYHLNQGYNEAELFLIWNQGNAGPCSSGVNSAGVRYDSCSYKNKGLAQLALR